MTPQYYPKPTIASTPQARALGAMSQSTPQIIALKPKTQPKVVQTAILPKKPKSVMVTKQVSDYGRAMNQAIKNTKSY